MSAWKLKPDAACNAFAPAQLPVGRWLKSALAPTPQDNNLGTMWLAKAAAHGHVIAQAQMHGLIGNTLSESPPTTTAKRD